MDTHAFDAAAHREAKRLLGQAAPHIKSSHRAEALARGLGYATNAALQAALEGGPVDVTMSREDFEGFLDARGYRVEELQIALLRDAVTLARGGSLDAIKVVPGGNERGPLRKCPFCLDRFVSQGAHNRMCHECTERQGALPGVHHAPDIVAGHLGRLLERGRPPSLDDLRGRPGWSDLLNGAKFKAKSAQGLRIRAIINDGDPADLTLGDRRFIDAYASLGIMSEYGARRVE